MDKATAAALFPGDSEMARRMRDFDWSRTPLGPVEQWPQGLQVAVRIMLTSRQPFWIGWGEQLTYLYNDPYKAIIGGKHPAALGQATQVVWKEIWDDIGPMLATAMAGQEGTYVEAQLLIMERNGYPEETYYTFSYSPIPGEDGRAGGILCANTDDTQRVIGERQLALLRELAARTSDARTVASACALSARCLETNPRDLPFAMLYLVEPEKSRVVLAGTSGIPTGHPAVPETVGLDDQAVWPFAEVVQTHRVRLVSDLASRVGDLPAGAWKQPPHQAAVVPIPASGRTGKAGILIAGLNPFRLFDDNYQRFLDLVASQIAAAIANAQAYEEERLRAETLAELDRAKTLFFTNISHEFRTPLTLMLGPVEEMLAQPESSELPEDRERLQVVHRHSLRLLKLVNTLLDFSRIEAGRMQAMYERTDIAALTSELASMFRSAIEKAGMRFVLDCPTIDAPVYVDREMWEKIVLNLLSNAFKFTFEGEIKVTLRQVGETVELIVQDTGVGIPEKDLPHVFERFHRVEGAKRRSHEGTGIGLALVYELAKLHGGSVRVQSVEGQGTSFVVSIPIGSVHLPPDRIDGTSTASSPLLTPDLYIDEAQRWLPEGVASDKGRVVSKDSSLAPRPLSLATPPRPRIVLADDNADMRDYVRRLLSQRFDVEAVADGAAALESVRRRPPDLMLSDVMMPRLDGFGLLRELRADPKTRTIPVILLSARAGEEARVEGLGHGADDYLIKPFSARELLARVDSHLALARRQRETEERISTILDSITDGFFTLDREWRFVYVNAEAERLNGMSRHDMLGKSQWELFPATLGTIVEKEFRRAVAEQVRVDFENFYEPWGRWFAIRAYPVKDGGLSVYFQDITESKHAEQKLRESEERFRAIVSQVTAGFAQADGSGRFTFVNDRYCDIVGYSRDELLHMRMQDITDPEIVAANVELYQHAMREGTSFVIEKQYLCKDGSRVWVNNYVAPIIGLDGKPQSVVCVTLDITERKKTEQVLRQQTEALRDADRRKDEFLATLAHELRNPLAPIRNSVHIMRLARGNGEIAEQARQTIERQLAQMVRLVDDLLDVSRITRNKIELRKERVALSSIVESAIETSRPLIEASGHELTVRVAPQTVWLHADLTRMAQVVANLLNNAAKYTPERGRIWLTAEPYEANAVIRVRDSGVGIPSEMLPHIFDMFTQVDASRDRAQGGLGIGLTLVKSLVEMHGGSVEAASDGLGKGSEFTVRLPIASADQVLRGAGSGGKGELGKRLPARRILVVDDNRESAESLGLLLEMMGNEVRIAHDGRSALEHVIAFRPDLALLDIGMPGMSGYELARRIRELPDARGMILAAVTGWGQEEDRLRSLEAGFDHHLTKPADLAALGKLLASVHAPK